MLKTAPLASCLITCSTKYKCAEIHYQESRFSILCIFCGMKTHSYDNFCAHFDEHVINFVNTTTTEELALNYMDYGAETNIHGKVDPLKLKGAQEIKGGTEYVGNALQHEDEQVKTVKSLNRNTFVEKQHISESLPDQQKEPLNNVESATKQMKPTIKLEDAAISNSRTSTSKDALEHHTESFGKAAETDNVQPLADNKLNLTIDWSKSYEPNLLKNTSKRPYKARNTPNKCTYCGKTFRRRLQLDTHLNIHTGSKPHQCEICGRQFRAITTLARHRNTHKHHHEVFNCKFCAKSFSRRAAMLSHELRHTQERHIPCDECDKQFYTLNQMDTHKRKVHNKADDATTLPFQCDLCAKRYRAASMLSTHKFKKHYKTAKIFCEKCDKKFVDEQQLEAHKTIHTSSIEKRS